MINKILLPIVCLFFFSISKGQEEYMVGTSRVSTEPDSTLFSIALSGYGYPAEGRFSINWILRGNAPANIVAITGLDGKFIAADSNRTLWSGSPSKDNISWKKIGTANSIKALAGMNGRIYAVNDNDDLLMAKSFQRNVKWKRIARAAAVKTLTALDGKLYATNDKNELLKMDPLLQDKNWTNIGRANDVRSLTSHGKRLFAINAADTLWNIQFKNDGVRWTEIGRYNGLTFNIHVKQITVLNNRLYAVSEDNKLYIGQHSTDGNLSATAFAIKRNSKTVVLVGVDLTGFEYSLTEEVKEIVFRKRNIPKSAILINASHTHFCPSAQDYLAWIEYLEHPDSLYLHSIVKMGLVKAIENALDNLAPANLYFGRGTTEIGLNRSSTDPENPLDKTLDVLEAKNSAGKVTGALFLAGCHAVFNTEGKEHYTLSANFPGVTRDIIKEKMGIDATFIQGCAGDINPRSLNHTQTGTDLANDIFKVMNGKMTRISGDISFSFDTINIPIIHTLPIQSDTSYNPSDALNIPIKSFDTDAVKQLKIDNAKKPGDIYARRNVKWADVVLNMHTKGTLPEILPEYIQIIDIGDWKMVGLSREVVNEYAPAIRDIWPGKIVSVAGYSNDVTSYLPNKWHVVKRLYEGFDSFFWYGQPGVPAINVFDVIINGIKTLKN